MFYGSSQLKQVYHGDVPVNRIYRGNTLLYVRDVTITILPNPSDATVVLTATGYTQSGNSITVKYGTTVNYTVSKASHITATGTINAVNDENIPVSLVNQNTLTINPSPSNATVTLTATGFTQIGNSILVNPGTSVNYSVSKTGYVTQSNTVTVNSDQTINVTLALSRHTITINPTPSDATVTFSTGTVSGNTCTVDYGTTVTYTVSKSSYETKSASVTVQSNQTIAVSLAYRPYTANQVLFESGTPGSYTFSPLVAGTYNVILVGGGSGCAAGAWRGLANVGQCTVHGGGSGGYTNKNMTINAGSYTVTVGGGGAGAKQEDPNRTSGYKSATSTAGGGSSIGSLVSVGGGGAASATHDGGGSVGAGGSGQTSNGNNGGSASKTQTGNFSISASGGAAVYGNYGAGGSGSAKHECYKVGSSYNHKCSATANAGSNGYVKITFISY